MILNLQYALDMIEKDGFQLELKSTSPVLLNQVKTYSYSDVTLDTDKLHKNSIMIAYKGVYKDLRSKAVQLYNSAEDGFDNSLLIIDDHQFASEKPYLYCSTDNIKRLYSYLVKLKYNSPDAGLLKVAITGTNGKTTTSHIISTILQSSGKNPILVGTNGIFFNGVIDDETLTTPDPEKFYSTLAKFKAQGADCLIMEMSSHALAQGRLSGISFDIAAFTNISQDHLDFHIDMESYYQAKKLLFSNYSNVAIVNQDDTYGDRLRSELSNESAKKVIAYSAKDTRSQYYAKPVSSDVGHTGTKTLNDFKKISFELNGFNYKSQLVGDFNIYNLIAATIVCLEIGLTSTDCQLGLDNLQGVPGRFDFFEKDGKVLAIIDYAHTPDAIENLLSSVHSMTNRKLMVVFGAGGDRDSLKRPIMGEAVAKYAHKAIITSDNPRSEDPMAIIKNVEEGFKRYIQTHPKNDLSTDSDSPSYELVVSRAEAIQRAAEYAGDEWLIMLLGKGHEKYQIIGDEQIDFDDKEFFKNALSK